LRQPWNNEDFLNEESRAPQATATYDRLGHVRELPMPKLSTLLLLAIGAAVAFGTLTAAAHHPYAETYHEDQEITIKGVVIELIYRNPHSYIHLMAPDDNQRMHRWAVEWRSRDQMRGTGVGSQTLRPGDEVIATGNPARDAAAWRLRLRSLVRPRDGWRWSDSSR
jgi:hypothetical protein